MFSKKYILPLICFLIFFSCSDNTSNEIDNVEDSSITEEVHKLINEHRISIGKNTLVFDNQVADIAIEHTEYMISKNKISHDGFDARFAQVRALVNAMSFAENVAYKQNSAQKVVTGWLSSAGHRANIEGDYTHTGIGVLKNASGNYYFTQLFYSK
ncbi:conserved exported protein of unknown function [Tenacibaculum soleae]|uniref:CAP domain-containing protein n=1 Tax=Tenacibaculum soleae TaxID=447689 RepID=UPI003AB5290D